MRTANVPPDVLAELQREYRTRLITRKIMELSTATIDKIIANNPDWTEADDTLDEWYPIDPN